MEFVKLMGIYSDGGHLLEMRGIYGGGGIDFIKIISLNKTIKN